MFKKPPKFYFQIHIKNRTTAHSFFGQGTSVGAGSPKDKMIHYANLQLCLLPKPTSINGSMLRWWSWRQICQSSTPPAFALGLVIYLHGMSWVSPRLFGVN
jgi:hypothetical protein